MTDSANSHLGTNTYPHHIHYCNINGIRSKKNDIIACLPRFPSSSLLAFVEAKIQSEDDAPKVAGFVTHAFPYQKSSSGIIHYSASGTQYRNLRQQSVTVKDDGSMLTLAQLCIDGLSFNLGVVYIHPAASTDTLERILKGVQGAASLTLPLLLVGDFNARHPRFGDYVRPSSKASHLVSFLDSHSLTVLNTINHLGKGTRDTSVLDLVITSHPHLFSMDIDIFPLISDHLSISITAHGPASRSSTPPPPMSLRWNTKKANWPLYHKLTEQRFSRWQGPNVYFVSNNTDAQTTIEHSCTDLTTALIDCANSCMPRARPRQTFSYSPHPNADLYDELHRLRRRIQKVKARVRVDAEMDNQTDSALRRRSTLATLTTQHSALKSMWTKAARDHCDARWSELLSKIAPKDQRIRWKMWKRTIPSGQRSLSSITLQDNKPVPTSLKDSLDNFASFYSSVMSDDQIPSWESKHPPPVRADRDQTFSDYVTRTLSTDIGSYDSPLNEPFTVDEIRSAARWLRASTAPGPDSISATFLSKGSPPLHTAITSIFNFSWTHSVLPTEWKKANAFAIFKKGDRSDPSSYRLISITSIIARLFERVVNNRLVAFLDSSHFFSDNQAGFRRQLSTLDNIYRLLRDAYSNLRRRGSGQLPVIFLDIIKAFDRVPHDLLLFKLSSDAQIHGKAWSWIRCFLANRQFRVTQNDHASDWFPATAGVPQGCVLSPLLFAIYINDLDSPFLNSTVLSMFADDVAAWPIHKDKQSIISKYKILRDLLFHVQQWSSTWGLDFSLTKSQILLFSNKRNPTMPARPLTLHNQQVGFVAHYKYLGLIFQSNGRWDHQFHSVVTKAKITANLIARINHRRHLPPRPLVTSTLVKYILIPQISYAIQYWRPTKTQFRTLNQIIATPLRRALGLHRTASALRTLWEFGIPDVESIRVCCFLQSISRAYRSHLSGNFLPSILINDITAATARRDADSSSSFYCRSIIDELHSMQLRHPSASKLPLDRKTLNAITASAMTTHWVTNSTVKARILKPSPDPPRYLHVDLKPVVCIRARLRLAVALTPQRKFIYRHTDSNQCCGEAGTTEHVILRCNRFAGARAACVRTLSSLSSPVTLTLDLALGLPPPNPCSIPRHHKKKFLQDLHDQCLHITGAYLASIDTISRL